MKRRGHFFKGQMAVVMTFAIATLLGAMALGTDVAVMYFNWVQLQKGADAAALAGAGWLVPSAVPSPSTPGPVAAGCASWSDVASQQACTYASNNGMTIDTANLKIFEPGLPAPAPSPNIQVWVNRSNLPYFFGKVIGLNTYNVSAKATAAETGAYSATIFPMVYQCSPPSNCPNFSGLSPAFPVTFGTKFTAGASGNWGWLNVGGGTGASGGSQLGTWVGNPGSDPTLAVGATVTTDPGRDVGNICSGWNSRMADFTAANTGYTPASRCSGSSSPSIASNDPLLVTVPVADISSCAGSCSSSPPSVTGFAEVYLTSVSTSSTGIGCSGGSGGGGSGGPNWYVTGCFVKELNPTVGGGGAPGSGNLGAIALSLIQ
jgi:hypothetical protein